MSRNIETGKRGELLAYNYLTEKGYRVVEKNYRFGRGEIDLIAEKDGLLVFIEVKYRSSDAFGYPEEAVGEKKASKVVSTANHYVFETEWKKDIRFDILAIDSNGNVSHFEDAFN
ncbi:MAG TPA: YraN family protein [Cytophagaceae bacterium]